MKKACITGITGQTGSYLAELLLEKDYKVYGLIRRSSNFNTQRIDHLYNHSNLELKYGDLCDSSGVIDFISSTKPDILYNLGAQSQVRTSFDLVEYTADTTGVSVFRCLDAIRKYSPHTHFVQASSSEIWGNSPAPQDENTKIDPRSPYAIAKAMGYFAVKNYREAYPNIFASNAIMFNTESPRRGRTFVTRKITYGAALIKEGLEDTLYLGNRTAKRSWTHAKDQVKALDLIANAQEPDDFCIGKEEIHSVQDFLELTFQKLNLDWKKYIKFDERLLRPTEVNELCPNTNKIRTKLGWEPLLSFDELVTEMIQSDLQKVKKLKG